MKTHEVSPRNRPLNIASIAAIFVGIAVGGTGLVFPINANQELATAQETATQSSEMVSQAGSDSSDAEAAAIQAADDRKTAESVALYAKADRSFLNFGSGSRAANQEQYEMDMAAAAMAYEKVLDAQTAAESAAADAEDALEVSTNAVDRAQDRADEASGTGSVLQLSGATLVVLSVLTFVLTRIFRTESAHSSETSSANGSAARIR